MVVLSRVTEYMLECGDVAPVRRKDVPASKLA